MLSRWAAYVLGMPGKKHAAGMAGRPSSLAAECAASEEGRPFLCVGEPAEAARGP